MKKQVSVLFLCVLMLFLFLVTIGQTSAKDSGETSTAAASATIFSEDFEGAFPGTSWLVGDWNSTNGYDYWGRSYYRDYAGSYSGWCAQQGTHSPVIIFYEDCESWPGTSPGLWYSGDSDSRNGQDSWGDSSYRRHGGYYSIYCAGAEGLGAGWNDFLGGWDNVIHRYDNYMEAYMFKYVDLSGYSSATLTFYYWLDCEYAWDFLAVRYYDPIEGWCKARTYSGPQASSGWQYGYVSIPTWTTRVGFLFHSDYSNVAEGAYLDDIRLLGTGQKPNYVDHQYDNYMDAVMYRPVSLTGYSLFTLSYWYWLDCEAGSPPFDYLQVMYYSGGWYYTDKHSGGYGYWQYSSTYIPKSATYVGFRFHTDSSVTDYGAYLDDIQCTGTNVFFSDGFESGSFIGWSGGGTSYGETRTVKTSPYPVYQGSHAARFTSNGGGGTEYAYCYKNTAAKGNLYARGYFKVATNGATGVSDRFYFIIFQAGSVNVAYAGWWRTSSGIRWVLMIRHGTILVSYLSATAPAIPIYGGWYRVELHWVQRSTGYAELFVNGVRVCYLTGKNTAYYGSVTKVRMGLATAINCASTTIYADNCALSTSYIGA